MKAFLIALQFLTRLPTPNYAQLQPKEIGQSVLYYPLVGLIIGAILASTDSILAFLPANILAAILLLLSVLINGALHLDGLADSADAWLAGGDKTRALKIMNDPHVGTAGVVAIVLLLLLKYALLNTIIATPHFLLFVLLPVIARTVPLFIMLTMAYANPQGIAKNMVLHLPKQASIGILITVLILTLLFNALATLVLLLGLLPLIVLMKKRLGGFTGDTLGALVEISEVLFLFGMILYVY